MKYMLKNPELMGIKTREGVFYGGTQEWYTDKWRRISGCGPTAAANLIWYLAASCRDTSRVLEVYDDTIDSYRIIQDEMFRHVTPGYMGVNSVEMFTRGLYSYADKYGLCLHIEVLEFPKIRANRPSDLQSMTFLQAALAEDSPVAFLNLSNGNQDNLEGWHWVTIVAVSDGKVADICDHGRIIRVNLSEWAETSMMGGAFARIEANRR